jgi:carboxypeptidase C (cathepsin A)
VRRALNIPDHVQAWQECNDDINENYAYQYEGSFWIYKVLKQYGYKILFYSGDTDGAVPTYGTRRWITQLNWPVKKPWTPWYTDGQVSGFIISYEGLDFSTIHGTGHMAPQWKRKEVTKLIMSWVHNEPIPQ